MASSFLSAPPLASFSSFYTLQFDGSSLGNPGSAGSGYVLKNKHGLVEAEGSNYLGISTNNEAEYDGLIQGMQVAYSMGVKVCIFVYLYICVCVW